MADVGRQVNDFFVPGLSVRVLLDNHRSSHGIGHNHQLASLDIDVAAQREIVALVKAQGGFIAAGQVDRRADQERFGIIDWSFVISPAIDLTGGNEATLRFYQSYDFTLGGDIDIEGGQLMIVT